VEVETGVHRKLSELVNAGKISDEDKRAVLGSLALAESLTEMSIASAVKGTSNPAAIATQMLSLLRDPMKEVAPPSPVPETPISAPSDVRKTVMAQAIEEKSKLYDELMKTKATEDVNETLRKAAAVLELEKALG
jgi:hypothetical protein